ncbi:hypothetical protein K490DRAFT_64249 [Saccharata proteae CBS 121410]|uniref:D-serine dehydratase n=1 Tax=Saccharata proteae CBS 121410 TaxID=1314787 RepID=A0A6A5YBM3_9PEZI|nr:hypothetical protein K490DRAFT_64249 [Saccharata proteae CBS 121410]
MDLSPEFVRSFIGKPAKELPTPAFVLSKPVLERNTQRLLNDVKNAGISFRPHVKTLKSLEVTKMMLGGVHKGVVASTLREIRGLLPLVEEGVLEEILYGLPVRPGALPELAKISEQVTVQLMVDHESQIDALEAFDSSHRWPIFIKIDMGTHRAGVQLTSPRLESLIRRAEKSSAVKIEGFYCHAGHSYSTRTPEAAVEILHDEVNAAVEASELQNVIGHFTVSFGSTPTAHVVSALRKELPQRITLELHAGNYPTNDLQQLGTGSIQETDQAIRILAEVCSVYPERNEALVNAGVIALAREPGPIPGFGRVVGRNDWYVGRLSQEHGILVTEKEGNAAEKDFAVGQKLFLHIQHACITAAAHHYYFVVDDEDVVRDVWFPWKGW